MEEEKLRAILEEFFARIQELLREEVVPEKRAPVPDGRLSTRTMAEIISHEGIVPEAYKDSKGVWTWGIGVTDASGHKVLRYKDNPQPLRKVFDIFDWLLRTKYLPDVQRAFTRPLTEEQLTAALSFHYNTGAIGRAEWVKSFNKGKDDLARDQIMNWKTPKEIIKRREKERDLFFDGKWSNDGTALIYSQVNKPSYTPKQSSAERINIEEELKTWAS